jgi:hypothetical protein
MPIFPKRWAELPILPILPFRIWNSALHIWKTSRVTCRDSYRFISINVFAPSTTSIAPFTYPA